MAVIMADFVETQCPTVAEPLSMMTADEVAGFTSSASSFTGFTILVNFETGGAAEEFHRAATEFMMRCLQADGWTVFETDDFLNEGWSVPGTLAGGVGNAFMTFDEVLVDDTVGMSFIAARVDAVLEDLYVIRDGRIRQMLVGLHGVETEA